MSLTIEQTINQLVIQQVDGDTLEITTQGPQGPAGPSTTFTVAGNSGPSQTIGNGDTLTLTSPVSFQQVVMSAVDTATFSWPDQTGNVFLASPANGSAGTPAFRAITFADLDAVLGTMAQQDANAVAITGGSAAFTATLSNTLTDAATNSISTVLTLGHNTSGTPAAGYGSRIVLQLQSATVANRDAATIEARWTVVADATRTSVLDFYAVLSGTLTNVANINGGGFNPATSLTFSLGTTTLRWNNVVARTFTTDASGLHFITDATSGINAFVISTDTNVATRQLLLIDHQGGTVANGFGGRVSIRLETSTSNSITAGEIEASWVVVTHASRTARVRHLVYDTAEREYMRGQASGSAPMIGFLGAAAIVRPTVTGSRGGNAAVASLLTELANLGLIVDSTSA